MAPRMGHLDPPFVDCHPPHINSFFVQFSRDGNTHMSSVLVFDSYQQMNAFGPYIYSVNFYPSNEWCRLSYSAPLWFKKQFSCHSKFWVSQFICFICPNGIKLGTKKTMCDLVPKGPPKKIKKGRQNEISTTCWLFFNAKVTNGSRKVHGVRMALACRSFGSSCGPYKAHETYAMFLH